MTTEKELGKALKEGQDTIEIEMDLCKKVIKIKVMGKPHAKKVYELVDADGIYTELRTIHPLFAGQRFSGKWKFRNYAFPDKEWLLGALAGLVPQTMIISEKIFSQVLRTDPVEKGLYKPLFELFFRVV